MTTEYPKTYNLFVRDKETHELTEEFYLPEFELLQDVDWVFTEKIDGMNIRVTWDGQYYTFAGRTDRANLPGDLVNKLNSLFNAENLSRAFPTASPEIPVVLYGEGFGPGIQKGGGNYGKEKDFILFDIKVGDYWFPREGLDEIAATLQIKLVPVVIRGTLLKGVQVVQQGLISKFGDFLAEGVIGQPRVTLLRENGERVKVKIKSRDFLRS